MHLSLLVSQVHREAGKMDSRQWVRKDFMPLPEATPVPITGAARRVAQTIKFNALSKRKFVEVSIREDVDELEVYPFVNEWSFSDSDGDDKK